MRALVLGCSAALLFATAASAQDMSLYQKPQTVVRLDDGRHINLACSGDGGPVVILLSGLGLPTDTWSRAQPLIAKTHKVCAFDRPGYRFSDPGPMPRTAVRTADDLHDALAKAGFKPPYILVAHSRAGFDVRQFAHLYPKDTAGLVLLDVNPGVPGDEGSAMEQAPPADDPAMACIRAVAENRLASDEALFKQCGSPKPGSDAARPEMAQAVLSETASLQGDATAVRAIRSYGPLPMVVLTAGDYSTKFEGDAKAQAETVREHQVLAAQSQRGVQRTIAGAGHVIMFEKPDVVSDAVEEVTRMAAMP